MQGIDCYFPPLIPKSSQLKKLETILTIALELDKKLVRINEADKCSSTSKKNKDLLPIIHLLKWDLQLGITFPPHISNRQGNSGVLQPKRKACRGAGPCSL